MCFSDPLSIQAWSIEWIYECACLLVVFIFSAVLYFLWFVVSQKVVWRSKLDHARLEFFWSIVPLFFLTVMCSVSVLVLYRNDECNHDPFLDIVVMGSQWYWSYSYSGSTMEKASYSSKAAEEGGLVSCLSVDYPLVIPYRRSVRFLVSSSDVIHSFSVPSLGVKIDAIPGRITRAVSGCILPGIMYGSCNELCGELHSNMPVIVESVSCSKFEEFLEALRYASVDHVEEVIVPVVDETYGDGCEVIDCSES
nr:cytochrome c oxidase subunit 2 [Propeamussium sp. mt1]